MAKVEQRINLESLKKDLRRVVLTGVGAAVLAKEGAADLAKKWLAKGEDVEPELKKALKKILERRKGVVEQANTMRAKVEGRLKKLVEAFPVVTRRDVNQLSSRLEALAEKVDALTRKRK